MLRNVLTIWLAACVNSQAHGVAHTSCKASNPSAVHLKGSGATSLVNSRTYRQISWIRHQLFMDLGTVSACSLLQLTLLHIPAWQKEAFL